MNNVSWFLYLSDVIPSLGLLLVVISIMFTIVIIVAFIYGRTAQADGLCYSTLYPKAYENGTNAITFVKKIIWVPFLLVTLAIFVPSKQTMYMIAASQVGEQIIQLEEVQDIGGEAGSLAKDAISLLRQQIQEQLTEKPAEAE